MPRMPLEGLRVLDVTQIRAGPKAARWLADAGAEVIKVESVTRPDGRFRVSSALALAGQAAAGARARYTRPIPESAQRETNRAGFDVLHRNKMGLSVNLRSEEGVAIFRALAAISDVVLDNFSQGVMDRLGLGYDDLRKVNPAIIVLSMPAFGSDGPDKSYIGFGWAQEHLSGVTSMTGYEGGPPLRTGTVTPDPLNGVHAAGAIMAALLHRARTGEGQYVELSHWESMISLVGDWLMEYSYNGTVARAHRQPSPGVGAAGLLPERGRGPLGRADGDVRRGVDGAVRRHRQAGARGRPAVRGRAGAAGEPRRAGRDNRRVDAGTFEPRGNGGASARRGAERGGAGQPGGDYQCSRGGPRYATPYHPPRRREPSVHQLAMAVLAHPPGRANGRADSR